MKSKILSLILVAAMLASMLVFVPTAGATTAVATVDVTETAGWAGDTVSVDVIVTSNALATFQGVFEYDGSRLELVDRVAADIFYTSGTADNSDIFVGFTSDGSFASIWGAGASVADATAGVSVATLTFKIKDDAPVGDAYIAFRYLSDRCYIQPDATTFYNQPGKVNWVAGAVTVLPEGGAPVTDPSAFEYTDNGDSITIDAYYGDAAILNIPAEIDGKPVTAIGPMMFISLSNRTTYKLDTTTNITQNDYVKHIIVPASVTSIGDYAFAHATALQSVTILGNSVTVGTHAIGVLPGDAGLSWKTAPPAQKGNINSTDSVYPAMLFMTDVDESEGFTDADGYATDADGYYYFAPKLSLTNADALGTYISNYVDNDYMKFRTTIVGTKSATITTTVGTATTTYTAFGDAIYAPGGDASLVAWQDADGNLYAPGADLGDITEIALTAITVAVPTTVDGVSLKLLADDVAMRFTANVDKTTYETLAALGTVEMGMLITPRVYVNKAGLFTMEALDALVGATSGAYVKIVSDGGYYAETDTAYTLAGSLKNFSAKTLANNPAFAAIAYLTVTTADGDTFTVYGQYDYLTTQDVKSFAEGVSTSNLTDTEKGWLTTLIGKFSA